jgi:hypothetical protein
MRYIARVRQPGERLLPRGQVQQRLAGRARRLPRDDGTNHGPFGLENLGLWCVRPVIIGGADIWCFNSRREVHGHFGGLPVRAGTAAERAGMSWRGSGWDQPCGFGWLLAA